MTWLEKMVEIGATPDRTASEEEILAYEQALGARFPRTFREFLLRYGACDLHDRDMVYPVGKDVLYLALLLDLNEIRETRIRFDARLPKLVLPFNDDGCENFLCVSLRPDSYGGIYYCDHSLAFESSEPNDDSELFSTNLEFIAEDFESFIIGLVDDYATE